jgi:hypothetical protein
LGPKVEVVEWEHWKSGGGLKLKQEKAKIIKLVGTDKVNIIAKSVGTRVTLAVLPLIEKQINKIIFCGIPTVSTTYLQLARKILNGFPAERIICFQNIADPFASHKEVKSFMHRANPKIKVIEKPRNDHQYPYFEDFKQFFI